MADALKEASAVLGISPFLRPYRAAVALGEEAAERGRQSLQERSSRPGTPSAEAVVAAAVADRAAQREVAIRRGTYALQAAAALSHKPQARPSRRAKTEAFSFSSPFFKVIVPGKRNQSGSVPSGANSRPNLHPK